MNRSIRNSSAPQGATLLLTALLVAPVAFGQEAAPAEPGGDQAKAKKIIEMADTAIKKIEAVRFAGSMEPTGLAVNFVTASRGGGYMEGWSSDLRLPAKFHVEVETTRLGSEEKVKFEGGGDGDTFFLIDHATKKGYEDMDPGVFGSAGNALQAIGMAEYVNPEPFGDELESELTYEGEEKVGDVNCHKVKVVYSGGRGASTWYFSTDDHLPRRRVRHFDMPQGKGAIDIQISTLEIGAKAQSSAFKMSLPEGYEQIDDFAP